MEQMDGWMDGWMDKPGPAAEELRVAAGGSGGGSALGGARHVHSVGLEAPHPARRGAARALDADEGRAGLCAATGQGRPQRAKIKKKKNPSFLPFLPPCFASNQFGTGRVGHMDQRRSAIDPGSTKNFFKKFQ